MVQQHELGLKTYVAFLTPVLVCRPEVFRTAGAPLAFPTLAPRFVRCDVRIVVDQKKPLAQQRSPALQTFELNFLFSEREMAEELRPGREAQATVLTVEPRGLYVGVVMLHASNLNSLLKLTLVVSLVESLPISPRTSDQTAGHLTDQGHILFTKARLTSLSHVTTLTSSTEQYLCIGHDHVGEGPSPRTTQRRYDNHRYRPMIIYRPWISERVVYSPGSSAANVRLVPTTEISLNSQR
uniref:Uncharacterized protein n=1 Tax=Timema cristinae TaxID=61476 RepID=A0A7R9CPA5_TIMCR|nr:unnamed protein product [Timema cristinae]